MKTVFITIYQAVEAKNILRTDVIRRLLVEPDVRVVCLTRFPERSDYYRTEIPHERIIYDAFYAVPKGLAERIFGALKFFILRTATTDLKRRLYLWDNKRYFRYYLELILNFVLARWPVRQIARFLDYHLVGDPGFGPLFDKYRPGVVFLAHLFDDVEIALLREARRRGIPTIGFINSWDKLTARCALRLLPDTLAVYNEIVKREAMQHADMPEEKIFVGGIPHYDYYVSARPTIRNAFCRSLDIAPTKRIIVYAPNGKYSLRADGPLIDLLHSFIERSLVPNAELLVRFQPNDEVDRSVIEKRPWLKYDIPGIRFSPERGGDWDMNASGFQHLLDTLYHASLFICYTSSLSVDAAVFDKPVINVNFELEKTEKLSQSPIQYYHMTHYKNAIASGGIRIVSTPEELLRWLNKYLDSPQTDEVGRHRLVREQCGELDGRAGERIAEFVLREL